MDPWPPRGPERQGGIATCLTAAERPGRPAVARAVERLVRPGSRVVVAAGGAGPLAFRWARMVLRAARRVYILEGDKPSPLSRALAAAAADGRLGVFSRQRRPALGPVDLIVLDAEGTTPAWALLSWAALAWERVGGPSTRVFPPGLEITIAPTRDPILHGATAAFWNRGVAGVRLGSAARALVRTPVLTRAARIDWLAPPLAFRYALAGCAPFRLGGRFEVARDGELTGFALGACPADESLSFAPPPGDGLLLPVPEPEPVGRGCLIEAVIEWRPGQAGGGWEWRWAIRIAGRSARWKRGRGAHGIPKAERPEPQAPRRLDTLARAGDR